jgi:hypothetical protein
MPTLDPVSQNIEGVRQLVESPMNKTSGGPMQEGVVGDREDAISLKMDDKELIILSRRWEANSMSYGDLIRQKSKLNFQYYLGRQLEGTSIARDKVIESNLIFEAEETFIPAALAKNPEPVVFAASKNPLAQELAKDVKTMLQYHADVLVLRRKLARAVRHWSVSYKGVLKHGWDKNINDITTDNILPDGLILDPDGSIDVYGNYVGKYLGEPKDATAQEVIDMFSDDTNPEASLTAEKKAFILSTVDGMLGTTIKYTEWWTNEYCFYTYKGIILDKHRNQYWNYDENKKNHFGRPKMPYSFLSVFSFGTQPDDVTTLIEQNIPNQDLVNKRISQIDRNLDVSNNSLAVSAENFNNETAKQAADALQAGRPILVPRGKSINEAIQRLPASNFPSDAFNQLNDMTNRTRSIFGTTGITPAGLEDDKTVRGKIMSSQQDSSRIGGGIGDSIEQLADNVFNWWMQLYAVFYDEEHFGAILGSDRAVQYITLTNSRFDERVVISVAPNSMKPKDEITEQNLAIDMWNAKALDPLTLFERLDDPDPKQTAERVVLWTTNPQQYMMTYFGEGEAQQMMGQPMQGAGTEQNIPSDPNAPLSQGPADPSLSQVPLNQVPV